MSQHQEGINPGFETSHTLSLDGLNAQNATQIAEGLEALPWVDHVQLKVGKQSLKISYEASHHNIDEVIAVIEQHGAAIKDSWWSRTRLGWQRQTDENIKDNARHEPHCCNKIPRT